MCRGHVRPSTAGSILPFSFAIIAITTILMIRLHMNGTLDAPVPPLKLGKRGILFFGRENGKVKVRRIVISCNGFGS